jgi:hypothetical protein
VNGNNILDAYANSNFYTGGTGTDQFYEDTRTLTQDSWSTVVNRGGRLGRYSVSLPLSGFSAGWLRNVRPSGRRAGRA